MELRIYEGRASLPECLVEMLYIAHTSLRSLTIHYTGEAPTQPSPLRNITLASRLLKTTFDRLYNAKLKRRLQQITVSFDHRLEKTAQITLKGSRFGIDAVSRSLHAEISVAEWPLVTYVTAEKEDGDVGVYELALAGYDRVMAAMMSGLLIDVWCHTEGPQAYSPLFDHEVEDVECVYVPVQQ
jgi:hypothetical protein